MSDTTASELREPENELGDFPETTAFERYAVKTSEKANTHNHALAYLELIGLLRVPWRHKKLQQRACIDSRMQSTSVASPCQTLRDLYTSGRPHSLAPAHQLAIPRMRSAPGVCTFINPRRACAARVTWFVCLSACLLPRLLRLRATRQQNSDTNGFIATLASF